MDPSIIQWVNSIPYSHKQIDHPNKKNQQENVRVKLQHRSNGMNRYLQNILCKMYRKHILYILNVQKTQKPVEHSLKQITKTSNKA
jgi:hypothetical protein